MCRTFGIIAFAAIAASGVPAFASGSAQVGITFISPANVYTLPVQIKTVSGAKKLDFVLDTGAAYIIAPPAALADVQKKKIGTIPLLLGGHLKYIMTRYRVASFTVGDCEFKDIEVDESTASALPILGESFLREVEPIGISTDKDGNAIFSFICSQQETTVADTPQQ